MEGLFSYSVLIHNSDSDSDDCTDYEIDGFREYGYPKDWDVFVDKVNEIIN